MNDDLPPLPSDWGFLTAEAQQAIRTYARQYAEQRVAVVRDRCAKLLEPSDEELLVIVGYRNPGQWESIWTLLRNRAAAIRSGS